MIRKKRIAPMKEFAFFPGTCQKQSIGVFLGLALLKRDCFTAKAHYLLPLVQHLRVKWTLNPLFLTTKQQAGQLTTFHVLPSFSGQAPQQANDGIGKASRWSEVLPVLGKWELTIPNTWRSTHS